MVEPSVWLIAGSWGGTGLVAVGLIVTWMRNGKSQSEKFGKIQERLNNVAEDIGEIKTVTSTIKETVNEQRNHCTKISTGLDLRVKFLEKEAENKHQRR